MKGKFLLVTLLAFLGTCYSKFVWLPHQYHPEQIHLSYGDNPTQMVITWVTLWPTNSTVVEYGISRLDTETQGKETLFIDGGSEKRHIYMHRVKLTSLIPGQKYFYHCGGEKGWSALYFFAAMKSGQSWSPRLAVYGDMGNIKGRSIPRLQEWAQKGKFDAVLHVGDLAYNLDTDNARMGDEFMRQIEPIAAYVPYMVSPGNHEEKYNFSNYKSRFSMPQNGDGENMYYSFDIGPVHVISFSSEVYYFYIDYRYIDKMYDWLKRDLEVANQPENRAVRPWIIALAHKPMYCTNSDDQPICFNKYNPVRVGSSLQVGRGLEDLFCNYGVDIYFAGHEHSYERLLPLYDFMVRNGSFHHPYTNPKATVHIVTGSAGNQEAQDPFKHVDHPFSVYHSDDYGFTMMYVHNVTHIHLQQVSDDKGGKIIDDFWVIKEKVGAPNFKCKKLRN